MKNRNKVKLSITLPPRMAAWLRRSAAKRRTHNVSQEICNHLTPAFKSRHAEGLTAPRAMQAKLNKLAKSLLDAFPPAMADSYETWLRVGSAVAKGGASRYVWDKWSKQSPKFDAEQQNGAWERISQPRSKKTNSRRALAGAR